MWSCCRRKRSHSARLYGHKEAQDNVSQKNGGHLGWRWMQQWKDEIAETKYTLFLLLASPSSMSKWRSSSVSLSSSSSRSSVSSDSILWGKPSIAAPNLRGSKAVRRRSTSVGSGRECRRHNSFKRIPTWFMTWLSMPEVLLSICTAFVTLVSSDSANHTGGVEG